MCTCVMCSVSIYCVSNNQMRGLLDVVLVEVEMVDAVVGRVVVTVVVRITSPLRCNHLLLDPLAVLISTFSFLTLEPVKLSNCEVRPESEARRGLVPARQTRGTCLASRRVGYWGSSLVLLAMDMACMTWGRKESDLRTVEGFRVGRLIDRGR